MRSERLDPRDQTLEVTVPVYRVYFWQRLEPLHDKPSHSRAYRLQAWRLVDAADLHEVISWAEARLAPGGCYQLFVERAESQGMGLIRLSGIDPTDPANASRGHSNDV